MVLICSVDNATSRAVKVVHACSIHSQVDTWVSNGLDGVDIGVLSNWYDEELLHYFTLAIRGAANSSSTT